MDLQSIEHNLLLLTARTSLTKEQEKEIDALAGQGIDWTYLAGIAKRHGISSLLYHNVGARYKNLIPAEVFAELRRDYQGQTVRNLNLTKHLAGILKVLNAEGIPVIPFKGPLLSLVAYQNIALRSFLDLDILVHLEDVYRAKALLITLGYHPLREYTSREEAAHLRSGVGYEFVSDDNQVFVELHWNLGPRWLSYRYDEKQLWARAGTANFAGETTLCLCALDLVIYLCVHGFKHSWSRLQWVCDLAQVLRYSPDLDWHTLLQRTRQQQNTRIVLLGLSLAINLLNAAVPTFVLEAIRRDTEVIYFTGLVKRTIFGDPDEKLKGRDSFMFHTRLRERLIDRLHFSERIADLWFSPNEQDRAFAPFPDSPKNLLYFWRLVRIVTQGGRRLSQRGRRNNAPEEDRESTRT